MTRAHADHTAADRTLAQRRARRALRSLARHLDWGPRMYELTLPSTSRAVDALATLHSDHLIVTITWPRRRAGGLLVRPCAGRADRIGGQNHVFDLAFLDRPADLAAALRQRFPVPQSRSAAAVA